MRPEPLSFNEPDRLAALAEYRLKEADSALGLDDIVQLASKLFDVPIVLVSMVEQERQFFSARVDLDVCETGRDVSITSFTASSRYSGEKFLFGRAKSLPFPITPL